jgi:magnesium-transporting ATPase (P-type)
MANRRWHQLTGDAVREALATPAEGLTGGEAARRLAEHGPNVLVEGTQRTVVGMFVGQFTDFMIPGWPSPRSRRSGT